MFTVIGLFSPITVNADASSTVSTAVDSKSTNSISTSAILLHTRSLAASCAACHGTKGNNVSDNVSDTAKLAGIDKADFLAKMIAFKSGERAATVMHHHAKGLSLQEINNLADYFTKQVIHPQAVLMPQNLSASATN